MKSFKRFIGLILALIMVFSLIPEFTLPAKAASGDGDVFEELGIDTSARPDDYIEGDSNPYGKNMITVNPIMEFYLSKASLSGQGRTGELYGDGLYSGSMADYFIGAEKDQSHNMTDENKFEATKAVAGNFTGSGLKEMVVAVGANSAENSGFSMFFVDPETGETYGKQLYSGAIGNAYEREWYLNNTKTGDDASYANKDILYNYLEIETGDFDGNGYDEIAVYIPDPSNPRVEVWQYQKTSQSDSDWYNWSKWKLIFTHYLTGYTSGGTKFAPSIVTLLSADINYDGVDDLAIGAGACTYDTNYGTMASSSYALYKRGTVSVLWGSKSGTALQARRDVLADMPVLPEGTYGVSAAGTDYTKDLQTLSPRFDLAFGDIYGVGQNQLFICTNTVVGVTSYNPDTNRFTLNDHFSVESKNYNNSVLSIRTDAVIARREQGTTSQLFWMNYLWGLNSDGDVAEVGRLQNAVDGAYPAQYGVSAADLNGDGIDELVMYHNDVTKNSVKSNFIDHAQQEIRVYYRSGGGWVSHSTKPADDTADNTRTRTAAGDFTGSGSKENSVTVSASAADDSGFSMNLTNPETGETSGKLLYDGAIGNDYEREWYLNNIKTGTDASYANIDILYNYLEIETGDFDGDGYDEIAVYIPDPSNPRVEVWRLDDAAQGGDWSDWDNWSLMSEHAFTDYVHSQVMFAPGIVTLLAADINADGVDDLAISAGACTYNTAYSTMTTSSSALYKSGSVEVFWGGESGALEISIVAIEDLSPRFDIVFGGIGNNNNRLIVCTNEKIQTLYYDYSYFRTGTTLIINGATTNAAEYGVLCIRPDAAIVRRSGQATQLFWMNHLWGLDYSGEWAKLSMVESAGSDTRFAQYDVTAKDLNGDGTDELVMRHSEVSRFLISGIFNSAYVVHAESEMLAYYLTDNTWDSRPYSGAERFNDYYALPDTDHDTMTMEYVGRVFQYSDPELLTVIAAPPTFGDLETVVGDDNTGGDEYIGNSETSFSRSTGTGTGDSDHVTLSAGAYISYEQEVTVPLIAQTVSKFEFEVEYKHEWTWDYERMSTETHTVSYTTNGFQDAVALYSVPTDHFIYKATMDDGNGNLVETMLSVSIPYKAVVKVMSVDEYDEVAKSSNGILPVVRGNILTHTWGDPATYPSEVIGKNALVYNGAWAGVHFGFGSITQSITLESEYSESFSHTDSIDFKLGGGPGSLVIGVTGGASWQRTDTEVELSGAEASGTITNMPEEARAYGYNYAWKLMWYTHSYYDSSIGKTIEVPVVTYLVRDVTAPPRMPQNFTADYAATTSNSITLIWDYDESVLGFQIWRQNKTPGMGGIYEALPDGYVAYIPGRTSYSFTDTNLAAATEYTYNIQVLRTKVPQGSVPSGAISVWTHAAVGAPTVILSKYDALLYPDTPLTVTSSLRDSPAGAVISAYSWEKYTNGKWTALSGVTTSALSISAPKLATAGQYRLAVSMTVNNQTVVGYSSPLTITVEKRTASLTLNTPVEDTANKTLTFSATLKNNFSASAAVPDGKLTFEVQRLDPVSGTFGEAVPYTVDIVRDTQKGTAEYTLKNVTGGMYKIKAIYAGNTVFDSAVSDDIDHVVGNDTTEPVLYAELPAETLYSYVPFEMRVYSAVKTNGVTTVKEITSTANEDGSVISSARAYNSNGNTYDNNGTVTYSAAGRIIVTNNVSASGYFGGWDSYVSVNVSLNGTNKTIESSHFMLEKLPVNMSLPSTTVTQSEVVALTLDDVTFSYPTVSGFSYNWLNYKSDFSVKCYNSAGDEVAMNTSMAAATYTIEVKYTGGNYGFSFNSVSATYVVTGETYCVKATAMPDNDTLAGSVALTSPEGNDNANWTTKYQYGTTLVFTATPYARYMVDKWVINGTDTISGDTMQDRNKLTYKMYAAPMSVEVYFKLKETKLTFTSIPEAGGRIELPNNQELSSGDYVYEATDLLFKAIPNSGYSFYMWQVITPSGYSNSMGDVDTDGLHTLSLAMPGTDLEVRAIWSRESYAITLGENLTAYYMFDTDGNAMTPDVKVTVKSGDYVPHGAELIVTPVAGITLTEWAAYPGTAALSENADGVGQKCTYTVTGAASFSANGYTLYTLTITAPANGAISVVVNGTPDTANNFANGVQFRSDDNVTLTAAAGPGYAVGYWTTKIGQTDVMHDLGKDEITFTMKSDMTLSHVFVEEDTNPKVAFDDLTMSCSDDASAVADDAEVTPGTYLTFTADIPTGHTVVKWTVTIGSVPVVAQTGGETYSLTMPGYDIAVAVETAAQTFAVTVNNGANGTYTLDCGSGVNPNAVPAGSTVTLSVTPDARWRILSVTAAAFDSETTVGGVTTYVIDSLTANTTITISYADDTDYAITVATSTNGTVTAPVTAKAGATITLAVTPDSGYKLDTLTVKKANGDPVVVGANYVFTMPESNVTVSAAFVSSGGSGGGGSGGGGGGTTVTESYITIINNGAEMKLSDIDTGKGYYVIDLTKTVSNNIYIEIPAPVLQELSAENPEFILDIATAFGRYRVPVNLASLIPGLDALLARNSLTANDISVKVTLTDVSTDSTISAALATSLPNARVMGTIVDFNVYVINTKTKAVLQDSEEFTESIVRMIPVNSKPRVRYGAFKYDEASRSFVFVPHTATVIDGQWYIAIASRTNSVYVVAENEVDFTDMPKTHWAISYIEKASAKRLVQGVGNNMYEPERSVTRAEFVQMMANAMMLLEVSTEAPAYNDVQPGSWYYNSIMRARSAGLLEEFTESGFNPNQEITREEMAVILAAVIKYGKHTVTGDTVDLKSRFNDYGDMNAGYLTYIELVCRLGLMQGVAEGTFDPTGATTRAQAATVQIRLLETLGMIDK